VVCHELGHLLDGNWLTHKAGTTYPNGINPAPDGYHPAMSGSGTLGREQVIVDAFITVYNPNGIYYQKTGHEFIAQMIALIWLEHIPDRTSDDITWWNSQLSASGFNSTVYNTVKTHLQSLGVFPSSGNWS
jgi:hypothetical protein